MTNYINHANWEVRGLCVQLSNRKRQYVQRKVPKRYWGWLVQATGSGWPHSKGFEQKLSGLLKPRQCHPCPQLWNWGSSPDAFWIELQGHSLLVWIFENFAYTQINSSGKSKKFDNLSSFHSVFILCLRLAVFLLGWLIRFYGSLLR